MSKKERSIQMQIIVQKEILSFKEAIIYLDVSQSFLYKLTHNKRIKFTKPNGGKLYFTKSDLNDWMMQNESVDVRVLEENILNYVKENEKKINK